MATVSPALMTTEELLALPDDGKERWLIRGELREVEMIWRDRWHSGTEAIIACVLVNWVRKQPAPRGRVFSGEAGIRLHRDPDTTVGIDVAYVSQEVMANQSDESTMINGVPVLAVEILSPSDTIENIDEKIRVYLDAGVEMVWIVHPRHETVTVHQRDQQPLQFNADQTLSCDPHLPGFELAVRELFPLD